MTSLVVLDTSALIRFFTADDKKKARQVKKLLESTTQLFIPEVVVLELTYVLLSVYLLSREQVIEKLEFLTALPNLTLSPETKRALQLYSSSALSIADCLVIAHAKTATIASFDKKLLKHNQVTPFWKE